MIKGLVSVIIPVFNSVNTIEETLQSVLKQTYKNLEIIVVNDGSTDDSVKVILNITDPRIKLYTQENLGVAAARNLALEKSEGSFIAFIDSDDIWRKDKVEISLNHLQKTQSDLIYTDIETFTENVAYSKPYKYIEPIIQPDDYLRLLIYDYISTLTVVVKKEVLEKVGVFDINLHGTEDWDLWIRIAKDYKLSYLPLALSFYRLSPNGLSHNRDKHLIEEKKVLNKHLNNNAPLNVVKMAYWVWYKKQFYNNAKQRYIKKAIGNYIRMLQLCPFKKENFLR